MRPALAAALVLALLATAAAAIPRATWPGMDWAGIAPVATDRQGDDLFGGTDLRSLAITHDASYLYLRIEQYGDVDKGTNYEIALDLLEPRENIAGYAANMYARGIIMWYVTERRRGGQEFPRAPANGLGAAIMYRGREVQIRIPLNLTGGGYRFRVQLNAWAPGDHEQAADRMNEPEWSIYPPGGAEATPITPSLLPSQAATPLPPPAWRGENWQGVAPVATDPQGDHDLGTDLKALYVKEDPAYLYVKLDLYTDSNNPSHVYEVLFDTDGDATPDLAANVQLDQKVHLYQYAPALAELPASGAAVVYGRNWMQVRIPRPPGLSAFKMAASVWPAGSGSPRPGDTVSEPGWSPPQSATPPSRLPAVLGIAAVAAALVVGATLLRRRGGEQG